jgi:hypothetical protein
VTARGQGADRAPLSDVGLDAFLADAATRAGGKLYAHGAGWNVLAVARIPAVHGHLALGLIFRVHEALAGEEHTFEIRLERDDGAIVALGEATLDDGSTVRSVERLGGTLRAGDVPPGAGEVERLVPVGIGFSGLRFERAGVHRFVVAIDGRDRRSVPFTVVTGAAAAPRPTDPPTAPG